MRAGGRKQPRNPRGAPRLAVLLVGLALLALFAGCGRGGEASAADEAVQRAYEAIRRPGMAYHAKGDDGSEVWLDVEGRRYRALQKEGEVLLLAVGEGWTAYRYDAFDNRVVTEDRSPQGAAKPRIDDPVALWFEPLSALAFGNEVRYIGETTADGQAVIALEARTPVVDQQNRPTGGSLVGRVELYPDTYEVYAFERRLELPPGQTPNPASLQEQQSTETRRVRYTEREFIPLAELPQDFFSPSHVEEQVVTPEENLQRVREAGLAPLWLGETYESERGLLGLQEGQEGIVVNSSEKTASFHYAVLLPSGPSKEAVVIKLGTAPQEQPTIPQYAGRLPEYDTEVMVRGLPATLYTSLLTPAALPCPSGVACPETDVPLYRRLQFQTDGAWVQIEVFARVGPDGVDQNPYNTDEGVVQLAEALRPAAEQ